MTHRIFFGFRLLEGSQDLISNRDGVGEALEPGRKPREFVVAEVAVTRPGREDQIVVLERDASAIGQVDEHAPSIPVDAGDLAEEHPGVPLRHQNPANRRGDLCRAEHGRRDLVQERLEHVVVLPIDEHHARVGLAERLRRGEAPEAASYDHYSRRRVGV